MSTGRSASAADFTENITGHDFMAYLNNGL
jgi:hypothetical protein